MERSDPLASGTSNFSSLQAIFKMIIDLQKFITEESPYWSELEKELDRLEAKPETRLKLRDLERFHYLYQRASAVVA